MVLAMTSTTRTAGQMYDIASNVLQQRLSQLDGIGEVDVVGSALPAVRVELDPGALFKYGIGLEDIRAALAAANANSPKGAVEDDDFHYQIYANDQATKADQYRDLVVAYRNNAAVKLSDVAQVVDSVEDLRNAGLSNGKPSVAIVLSRQPGANIIQAVDGVKAELPRLAASLPGDVDLNVVVDRSITIRGSLADTERTLLTSVALVILVVFVFLRNVRAAADAERRRAGVDPRRVRRDVSARLQPRQSVADGADDLDRLRRRRRDRRAGEHQPAYRARRDAVPGRDPRRARGRLHRAVDQPVADRGVPAAAADGQHRRPAVPRIRDDAVGGGDDLARRLADDDADDVLADPAAPGDRDPRTALSDHRARLRRDARLLSRDACWRRCAIRCSSC